MTRISKTSFWLKWAFPLAWFGAALYFPIWHIVLGDIRPEVLIVPIGLIIVGLLIMKFVIWNLADEVHDGGDYLLFRNGSSKQKVWFQDIEDVNYNGILSPPRVTVTSRKSGPLGKKLHFQGPLTFNPFAKPPLIQDLFARIEKSRQAQRDRTS